MNDEWGDPDDSDGRPFTFHERKQLRGLLLSGFTLNERVALRSILEREKRVSWAYAMIKAILLWGAGTLTGLMAFKDQIKQFLGIHP